jgi:hypothetical protein
LREALNVICQQCGATNADEAIFCQKCGKRLETREQDDPTLYAPLPASPYGNAPYTIYNPSESIYPPPPPDLSSGSSFTPYQETFSTRSHGSRIYLVIITILVIMLIGAGVFVGIALGKANTPGTITKTNITATPVTMPPSPTTAPLTPTAPPTQTHTIIYTEAPLSDGRIQAFMAFPHETWIMSRWWVDMNGDCNSWQGSTYPSSKSGVIGLSGYIQQGITNLKVWLDDGSCWQFQKLTTNSNSGWTDFYRC